LVIKTLDPDWIRIRIQTQFNDPDPQLCYKVERNYENISTKERVDLPEVVRAGLPPPWNLSCCQALFMFLGPPLAEQFKRKVIINAVNSNQGVNLSESCAF